MFMNNKLLTDPLEPKKEAKRRFDALRRNIPDAHTLFERLVPKCSQTVALQDGHLHFTRRASVSPSE